MAFKIYIRGAELLSCMISKSVIVNEVFVIPISDTFDHKFNKTVNKSH